jgi:hypothetical protein
MDFTTGLLFNIPATRAASVRQLEANAFYRVMPPRAANRHI